MRLLESLLGSLWGSRPDSSPPLAQDDHGDFTAVDVDLIVAMAQRMVDVVNESMRIASRSKNIETRRSRVRVAREKIEQVQQLAAEYPFLKVQRLGDVERDLAKIETETDQASSFAAAPSPGSVYPKDDRILRGMRFAAVPSIRTPLATLKHHGEERGLNDDLPAIPFGHWSPVPKTFREIGFDIDEPGGSRIGATEVGAVNVDRYIEFLIALKQAAISSLSIDECALAVDQICELPSNRDYVEAHGGDRAFIERLFPTVLEMLDFIPTLVRSDMAAAGLTTVERIGSASDSLLLAIAGLGPTRLRKLRAWCRDFQGDRNSSRLAANDAARLRGLQW